MSGKKNKKLRKEIGYDIKKEREQEGGRKYFSLQHKTEKDEDGNPKTCGIVCDKDRRLYKLLKKYS